ncbi:MAG: deoxynucleoside kinase [Bacteroidales bacterium]|jgi:deoxyadenosine/deoxycytidine kinase|nr:deoxynucleoside kinase [Bacteroidales bacterium]
MYIAVAGNIGAGKTTLTKLLAKHCNWVPEFDNINTNPYLSSFYGDMQRWSFNLQIYFLNVRCRKILEIKRKRKTVIHDRSIYEDAQIFAPNLLSMGLMANRDYSNYISLFELMENFIQVPDLLIYIKASTVTLKSQIIKRGRVLERNIRSEYLQNLNERYDEWISNYKKGKVLIINADNLNFAESQEDFQTVLSMVNETLDKKK